MHYRFQTWPGTQISFSDPPLSVGRLVIMLRIDINKVQNTLLAS